MEKYLTPADVVERVPSTMLGYWAQLRYTGKGPRFVKPSAGKVLYTEAALREWLASKEPDKTGAIA